MSCLAFSGGTTRITKLLKLFFLGKQSSVTLSHVPPACKRTLVSCILHLLVITPCFLGMSEQCSDGIY